MNKSGRPRAKLSPTFIALVRKSGKETNKRGFASGLSVQAQKDLIMQRLKTNSNVNNPRVKWLLENGSGRKQFRDKLEEVICAV